MKVILGCDPLLMPLTGIGHYTLNLGQQLLHDPRVDSLHLFAHAKFFDNSLLAPRAEAIKATSQPQSIAQKMRTAMSRSTLIVKAYEQIMPKLNRLQLRNHSDAIFHSPNFLMPEFSGKTVVTIHDLSTIRFPEFHPPARVGLVNNTIKLACNHADLLVTDAECVRQELIDTFGVEEERVVSVHLGAAEHFKPRSEVDCASTLIDHQLHYNQFFLFVSTLEPRKNLLRLLKAYNEYRQQNADGMPLVLIGSAGWQRESFSEILNTLVVKGWVKHLGYADDLALAKLYASARALIFPSIYEGFGLPVLEAMQSGTAILTSQNSSMSEITAGNSLLVDPESELEIAQGMQRLQIDLAFVRSLELNGVQRAKDFSWEKCGNEMIQHYQKLK